MILYLSSRNALYIHQQVAALALGCTRTIVACGVLVPWSTKDTTGAKIFDGLCGVLLLGELHLKSSHAFKKKKTKIGL